MYVLRTDLYDSSFSFYSPDIDECSSEATLTCSDNSTCVNTQGSYKCTCDAGFFKDGSNCTGEHTLGMSTTLSRGMWFESLCISSDSNIGFPGAMINIDLYKRINETK